MAIRSIGVGSNLDLEGLLTNLLNAERVPTESRLAIREADIQSHVSAFGNLKSALSKFRASLAGLRDASSLATRSATSSDSSLFSATAGAEAVSGSYSVQVLNLAAAHRLVSADFAGGDDLVGEGTLTLNSGDDSFDIDTSASTTLRELRDAINDSAANSSVTATLLTVDDGLGSGGTVTKLVLSARSSGEYSAISISVNDIDGINDDGTGLSRFHFQDGDPQNQLIELQQALDARIAVDGFTAYSDTNAFSDVIDGVTITALREPEDPLAPETATLAVAINRNNLLARAQEFVKSYNEARQTIRDLTAYDAQTGVGGPLLGDASVRNIDSGLKRILGAAVDGTEEFSTLSSIGIAIQRDGTLAVNASRLNSALGSNFDDVVTLFTAETGVTQRLSDALDNYLDSDGIIRARTDGYDAQLKDIQQQRDRLELRIAAIEQRYRLQFTALDQLVSRLQSSGDFLLAQLENTSKIITRTPGGGN